MDGLAMGSPLGPLMANAIMCKVEGKLERDGKMPEDYNRYVDDTLNLSTDIGTAIMFHQTLNDAHPSLTFTMEVQKDGQLPFLGMLITKEDIRISTSVYGQPTDTGLFLHYQSHVDKRYKTGLISSSESFQEECDRIRSRFVLLKYPEALVKSVILEFTTDNAPG